MRKPNCEKCKRKLCLETSKPCRKVENWLAKKWSKEGYSERYVRMKEIPYNAYWFDTNFFLKMKEEKETGRRKKPYTMDNQD